MTDQRVGAFLRQNFWFPLEVRLAKKQVPRILSMGCRGGEGAWLQSGLEVQVQGSTFLQRQDTSLSQSKYACSEHVFYVLWCILPNHSLQPLARMGWHMSPYWVRSALIRRGSLDSSGSSSPLVTLAWLDTGCSNFVHMVPSLKGTPIFRWVQGWSVAFSVNIFISRLCRQWWLVGQIFGANFYPFVVGSSTFVVCFVIMFHSTPVPSHKCWLFVWNDSIGP